MAYSFFYYNWLHALATCIFVCCFPHPCLYNSGSKSRVRTLCPKDTITSVALTFGNARNRTLRLLVQCPVPQRLPVDIKQEMLTVPQRLTGR